MAEVEEPALEAAQVQARALPGSPVKTVRVWRRLQTVLAAAQAALTAAQACCTRSGTLKVKMRFPG